MSNIKSNSDNDFILVNITEELVKQTVENTIKTIDMCQCEKCRISACAIALNSLESHYVTTNKGAILAQVESFNVENNTKLLVEVTKALMHVKDKPWHEFKIFKE